MSGTSESNVYTTEAGAVNTVAVKCGFKVLCSEQAPLGFWVVVVAFYVRVNSSKPSSPMHTDEVQTLTIHQGPLLNCRVICIPAGI